MEPTRVFPWRVRRLGVVMEPNPTDPREAGGVLNPATARGPDGQLYLLPRLATVENYSRIGLARVVFNRRGDPVGVERLGVVLEPQAAYELNTRTGGGVEDPRVTHLAARGVYFMTYTAYGQAGARIAAAVSRDLVRWRRIGLVRFAPFHGLDLAALDNKDAALFPEPTRAPDGRLALALIHRPTFQTPHVQVPERRPSMWISYAPLDEITVGRHVVFGQHHLLAAPQQGWEHVKVGGGPPPLRVGEGWLVFYHGVSVQATGDRRQATGERRLCYRAGVLLLDVEEPWRVLYRSGRSILAPRVPAEHHGVTPRVVFPTGWDVRSDNTIDLYYGMADSRIGVARTCLTHLLTSPWGQAA
jgi:beta-1,2-mannobiose phosphorylase / 1,2-beta-oligomannan phosphorylase